MSCFSEDLEKCDEKCDEEQKKICEYAKRAAEIAGQEGDKKFCDKIKQKKPPINGTSQFHPKIGTWFFSTFGEHADLKL